MNIVEVLKKEKMKPILLLIYDMKAFEVEVIVDLETLIDLISSWPLISRSVPELRVCSAAAYL